jgi:Protein of unknown function (DUF2510)/Scramblase
VTEVRQQGQTAGWREDPYGRHELRFFDGSRWTPYVRDGETDSMDEPGGPMGESTRQHGRSALLTDNVFVVERFTDLGRRWSDRSVLRPDGTTAGMLRRAAPSVSRSAGLKALVARDQTKNDIVELVDDKQAVVLTLIRPVGPAKSSVEVRDSAGRDAGRIVQQNLRRTETTYSFLGPNGHFLGDLQAENWVAWDLRVMDGHARQVATITRDWKGLDLSKFQRPDDYVVRITDSVNEPLRTLVVACALSLEVVVKPQVAGL